MQLPQIGPAVPRRGTFLTRWLGRTMLHILRWRVVGSLPDLPQFVIIAAPHTSNWDFVIGVATRLALNLDVSWLGKHTLFKGTLAPFLFWLHGIPVNRAAPHGLISNLAARFKHGKPFLLALAPEGTRSKVRRWKTGFYFIALQTGIPVVPVSLDYRKRRVEMMEAFWPTGHLEEDLAALQALYQQVTPRHREKFSLPEPI